MRALRIHDENAPLAHVLPGKQIHQRNKSTPALSSLVQNGAQKVVAKRTAFADVSNTSRVQPAQDDSVVNGKISKVSVYEFQKPAVLTKAAQRPLAVKTSSLPVSNVTSIPVKHVASHIPAPQIQPAVARKIAPMRSASALKDIARSERVEEITSEPVTVDEPQPDLEAIREESIAVSGPVQPVTAPIVPSSFDDQYILALEHQAQTLESQRNVALENETAFNPEFDDEDDLEFEAEDNTRNMTGGVTATTVVLAPRYTKKVQQELNEAKIIVEGARTAEDIEEEQWDTSMVAEYGEEIFEYMRGLEVSPERRVVWRITWLTFCRNVCARIPTTWIYSRTFNGPCAQSLSTGWSRSIIASNCCQKLCSSRSTISIAFCPSRLSR